MVIGFTRYEKTPQEIACLAYSKSSYALKNTSSVIGKKDLSFYVSDNIFMKAYTSVGGVTYAGYQLGSWYEYKNNFTVYFKIPKSSSGEDYEYSTSKTQLFNVNSDLDYYDVTEAGEVGCAVKYVEGASKAELKRIRTCSRKYHRLYRKTWKNPLWYTVIYCRAMLRRKCRKQRRKKRKNRQRKSRQSENS